MSWKKGKEMNSLTFCLSGLVFLSLPSIFFFFPFRLLSPPSVDFIYLPFFPSSFLSTCCLSFFLVFPSPPFPLQVRRTIVAVWAGSVSRIWCVRRNVAVKAPWSTAPTSNWPAYLRTSPNTPRTCKSAGVLLLHTQTCCVLCATHDEMSDWKPCVRLLWPETVNHHTSFNMPQTFQEIFHFFRHMETCTYAMHTHTSTSLSLSLSLRLHLSSIVNVSFHF